MDRVPDEQPDMVGYGERAFAHLIKGLRGKVRVEAPRAVTRQLGAQEP